MAPADWPNTVIRSGVAAKGCNIAPYPFQRCDLVQQSIIAAAPVFVAQGLMGQVPQGAQTVFNGHKQNTLLRQCVSIKGDLVTVT